MLLRIVKERSSGVNQGYTNLTGYTLEELHRLKGRSLKETVINLEMDDIIELCLDTKECITYEAIHLTKDMRELWVSSSLTPFVRNGEVEKLIVIDTDITQMKMNELELMNAKYQAEKSDKVKEQFMANLSHEIRTPMNAVMGLGNLLLKTRLDAKQLKYVKGIRSSADNILSVVNEVLDFAKIEAGKVEFESIEFNLKELFSNLVQTFQFKADEKNLNLLTAIDKKIPDPIIGDSVRLNQVLLNLVSNAIKFTDNGKVNIRARLVYEADNDVTILYSVTDTGIGIPEHKLAKVFESYTQASKETTRKYGGTGLGLTIVKQIVELQNGSIDVKSKVGIGTTFSFILTFERGDDVKVDPKELVPEKKTEKVGAIRVLIADDNKLNQEVLTDHINDWDPEIKVGVADNGREAVTKLEAGHYDIILMDIQMPEMTGYEASRQIRDKLPYPKNSIPIIAVTAATTKEEQDECFRAGMNDYVVKPVDTELLFEKIFHLLQDRDELDVPKSEPAVETQEVETDVDLEQAILAATQGSPKRALKYVDILLKNLPEDNKTLQDNLKKENWGEVKALAHKMKTSFLFLKMQELEPVIKDIEHFAGKQVNLEKVPELVNVVDEACKDATDSLSNIRVKFINNL